MSEAKHNRNAAQEAAVRNYSYFCATALLVMWLALLNVLRSEERWWSAFPVLVGMLALLVRWRLAPALLLVALLGSLSRDVFGHQGWWIESQRVNPVAQVILCGSVLAFVAGNFRLQGLAFAILPPDNRIPRTVRLLSRLRHETRDPLKNNLTSPFAPSAAALPGPHLQPRSHKAMSPAELLLLGMSIPVWASLGLLCWSVLRRQQTTMDMPDPAYRGMLVVWLLGMAVLVAWGAFGYLRWSSWRPVQANQYLQDALWRETRSEQARLNRWIAWARRKTRSRKDKP